MIDRDVYDSLFRIIYKKDKKLCDCKKGELLDVIKVIYSENKLLNKALDKACELLIEAVSQDCTIFDEVIKENYICRTEIDEWKELIIKYVD